MKKDPRELFSSSRLIQVTHTKFRIMICRNRFLTDQKKWEGSKLETMFDII